MDFSRFYNLFKSLQLLLLYFTVFRFFFANICASKTFFVQERTPRHSALQQGLIFMPLRADESIKTHPISRQQATHTNTFIFLSSMRYRPDSKVGLSLNKRRPWSRILSPLKTFPTVNPSWVFSIRFKLKGGVRNVSMQLQMKWPKRSESLTYHSSDLNPFPRDLLLQPSINWKFSALLHHT